MVATTSATRLTYRVSWPDGETRTLGTVLAGWARLEPRCPQVASECGSRNRGRPACELARPMLDTPDSIRPDTATSKGMCTMSDFNEDPLEYIKINYIDQGLACLMPEDQILWLVSEVERLREENDSLRQER